MISTMFSISLIILGSFLEIYYYLWRFKNDGISVWLSVVMGIGLTLMLTLAVYFRRKRWSWLIIIPVALYSIMATSAGQAFSLGIVQREEQQQAAQSEYVLDEITDVEAQIEYIDSELINLREVIGATVESLEDRGYWRTTLATAEERERELRAERAELSVRLSGLRSQAVVHERVEKSARNIYQFYGDLFGWSEESLQFILQTILSAFIAVMAPLGIMTLQKNPDKKKRKRRKKSQASDDPGIPVDRITEWIHVNWIGMRTGKSSKLLPRETFDRFMSEHGRPFDRALYNTVKSYAVKSGVISPEGTIRERDEKKACDRIKSVDKK